MTTKYTLPNLRGYLVSEGMSMAEFQAEVFKTVGTNVSSRTWSAAVNATGAGDLSVNKIIIAAKQTFAALAKEPDESVLEKVMVHPAPPTSGPSSALQSTTVKA